MNMNKSLCCTLNGGTFWARCSLIVAENTVAIKVLCVESRYTFFALTNCSNLQQRSVTLFWREKLDAYQEKNCTYCCCRAANAMLHNFLKGLKHIIFWLPFFAFPVINFKMLLVRCQNWLSTKYIAYITFISNLSAQEGRKQSSTRGRMQIDKK